MKNTNKADGLITIKGTQTIDGEKDAVELLTAGTYFIKDGSYYICYDESDATGYGGSHTTLQYDPLHSQVTLSRRGSTHSELIIEEGRRHQCTYDTGFGNMILGVSGNRIESTLTERGGEIRFRYSLDVNTILASENGVSVSVKLN